MSENDKDFDSVFDAALGYLLQEGFLEQFVNDQGEVCVKQVAEAGSIDV